MDEKLIEAARKAFSTTAPSVRLGAPLSGGVAFPEPLVCLPISMLNRHGLIAGATGTGKTRTLQLVAEQLSAAGVPVFLADMKGDLSGLGVAGKTSERIEQRAKETGYSWRSSEFPVEFLSLTGAKGAHLRATVSSFGPLLLAKVLDLNETQTGALTLVFKYCDDRKLPLLDLADLRTVLQHLTGDGAGELKDLGGLAKPTAGVLLRKMAELEHQGALAFFGEPEFDLDDLFVVDSQGRGRISALELTDVQDKPALFSTFLLWLLVRLYHESPEIGDTPKPKLVFFFDEAHLLFSDASKAFLDSVEQVIRLIRSKGIGVFFVTQSPKDIPADVLAQLGHRIQHALRAHTADDEKALRAAARTFPRTAFYDIEQTLLSLGIGEALVTVLSPEGVPTEPFATRLVPPSASMGPMDASDFAARLAASEQVRAYARALDRESAREILEGRLAPAGPGGRTAAGEEGRGAGKKGTGTLEEVLRSPLTRTVTREVARGLLGALLGTPPRRRRTIL